MNKEINFVLVGLSGNHLVHLALSLLVALVTFESLKKEMQRIPGTLKPRKILLTI